MTRLATRVIMLGCGDHARVLQDLLAEQNLDVSGYLAPSSEDSSLIGVQWLGQDSDLLGLDPILIQLVNGIGSISSTKLRRSVYDNATSSGYSFRIVVDERAIVRASAILGNGAQVLSGAVVGSDVHVGDNVIVNSGAVIEHGSIIGAHSHVAPGAVLSGRVVVGESTHIGVGATIVQGVTIGAHSTIGAGAVVIRDVPEGSLAIGVPAVSRLLDRN